MERVQYKDILNSIKTDNLIIFTKYIESNENLSFGRFPILTLCYLYNAKKIILKHEKKLISINDYKRTDEPFEIYQKFKNIANRTLRLYIGQDNLITPIEMLAILHKDNKVKKQYKLCKSNNLITDKVIKNLESIYNIYCQQPLILNTQIKLSPLPLTKYQKKPYKIGITLSSSFIFVFTIFYLLLNFTTGFGTTWNPYKISNINQLLKAFSSNGSYVLVKDITINEDIGNISFSGTLDGGNYNIYINSLPTKSLIDNNKGTLKNLNIKYSNLESEVSNDLSLFVNDNEGIIDNVKLSCDSLNLKCNQTGSKEIRLTGFAINNSGNINGCFLNINSTISTSSKRECTFSGFAINNSGIISNCEVLEGSISTNEVDVSGICTNNELNGKITNCKNYAQLSQTSKINEWSPTIAGIVLANYGNVDNCINKGELTITSNNIEDNAQGNVFLGGISAMNYGNHNRCLNKGNLIALSEKVIVYAGGITAYSSYRVDNQTTILPNVENCGASGNINVKTNNENIYAFAGGLCGFLYGEMSNCYSLSTYTNAYTEGKYFFGSAIGCAYMQYNFWSSYICLELSNNHVLSLDNAYYQIGSLISNGTIVSAGLDLTQGITKVYTISELQQLEVYWDE